MSERHELAKEFLELASESEAPGCSEAATTYAAAVAPFPEVSLRQRDFDAVVDHISQVCDVDRPDCTARELD